jgi:hypothetical protein
MRKEGDVLYSIPGGDGRRKRKRAWCIADVLLLQQVQGLAGPPLRPPRQTKS